MGNEHPVPVDIIPSLEPVLGVLQHHLVNGAAILFAWGHLAVLHLDAGLQLQQIAAESGIAAADGALEVGPGVGCLTAELAKTAGRVTAIELDERLRDVLAETLADFDNVSVVFADALKADLPAVCAETLGNRPWKVCANLPYNVTTPLITAFLEAGCFESVTVMIQKEVAERLCAAPGTGEYGAFSVLVQWYAESRLLFDVPPHCFVPQPKVTSAVVRMDRRAAPPAQVDDEKLFFRTVRAAFAQRRKTLSNALRSGFSELDRADIASAMEEALLSPAVRGETLSIMQFAALSNALLRKFDK